MNLVPHLTRGRRLLCLPIDKKLCHVSSMKTCSTADPDPPQAGAGVSSWLGIKFMDAKVSSLACPVLQILTFGPQNFRTSKNILKKLFFPSVKLNHGNDVCIIVRLLLFFCFEHLTNFPQRPLCFFAA